VLLQRIVYLLMALAAGSFCAVARAEDPVPESAQPPASTVKTMEPSATEAILGSRVVDSKDKTLGRLVDVLVDAKGEPQAAVIDFGGFMGVGSRKVAVRWNTLHFNPADGKHVAVLEMTPDQIKAAPEYSSPDKPAPVVAPAETPADKTVQTQ
jgi:hypothetical protein